MVKTSNSAPKGKEKSEKMGMGAKGGTTKMSGQNYVGPQTPFQSTSGGQKSNPPVKGGRTGLQGKQRGASPARPGLASSGGHDKFDNTFKVSGGSGRMAGFSPASPAKAR